MNNNPVNFVDPSGHVPICLDDWCHPTKAAVSPPPLYILEGEFTREQTAAVDQATQDVADALADGYNRRRNGLRNSGIPIMDGYGYQTPQQAFYSAYGGPVTFVMGTCDDEAACSAGYTYSKNKILLNPYYLQGPGHEEFYWVENPRLIVHELGHAFNGAFGGRPYDNVPNDLLRPLVNNVNVIDHTGGDGRQFYGYFRGWGGVNAWQFGYTGSRAGEEFADMFVGWVYNTWDMTSTLGPQKAQHMNTQMINFLSP